ncbi:PREDICTED: G-box-binding factor 1 isoform X2 [Tarenaya hassleriana]|uniref:G-box-binding factor 1 isoform X2 n=1 Tax=Tarenaya hassleriana TaxID=28532 RepID=UPI00053C590E|nr:PREDICTED: G-box-binding factor 1 isoform X2 [Tarenaya hassleriana]
MSTGKESTPSKPSKPPSSTQEVPSTPYPDWTSSMQAYYGAGGTPPPFFPSPVASPSPHPYMWGGQHPMMPPYGTPVPYPAMYPPGGVYAHPSMPMVHNSAPANIENVVKDQASAKKSKGDQKGKGEGGEKAASGSGNDGVSQSDESATEGSSDGNGENANQQEQGSSRKGRFEQMLADAASSQNKTTGAVQGSMPMKPVAPATNLNIGMDLWSSGGAAKMRPNTSGAIGVASEQWTDERELKRQKRKQSNRESARRSRLRKQAECEQLQQRVESLTNENHGLREELQRLSEECEKLKTENNSIKDELTRLCGPEAVANLEQTAMSGGASVTKDSEAK